jgi:hypothetical protein
MARQISQDEETAHMFTTMWVSTWASTVAGQHTNQTSYDLTALQMPTNPFTATHGTPKDH